MNTNLAIAIPTYNRAEILYENLVQIVPDLVQYDIPIYISDDSTNQATQIIIDNFKLKYYSNVFYAKNDPSLGHDRNCISTLNLPSARYVWYLGDAMIIRTDAIKKILGVIENDTFDFICFNAVGRKFNLESKTFLKPSELIEELAWHLTMSGITVYHESVIKSAENYNLTLYKNFPQTAIILNYFAGGGKRLAWINEAFVEGNSKKESYWLKNIFDVFFDDLNTMAHNLSNTYTENQKNGIVRSHSEYTKIFGIHSLVKYRMLGFFNYKILRKQQLKLQQYTYTNLIGAYLIVFTPISLLKKLYVMLQKCKALVS